MEEKASFQTLNQEQNTALDIVMRNALTISNGSKESLIVKIGNQVLTTLIQEKDIMEHVALNWISGKQILNQHN